MKEEGKDLEDILAPSEAPSRVTQDGTPKTAKLTGRTISSLRQKIKEKNLAKAYRRYNEKYQKMKNALRKAEDLREKREAGENVTKAEVDLAYDYVVDKYSGTLARKGARLLKNDISKIQLIDSPKRIKIPRILNTLLHKLSMRLAKGTTISEGIAKIKQNHQIKEATKSYIRSSLKGAIFEKPNVKTEDRELKDEVDAKVIRDLGLKGTKDEVEHRLDTLRGFISQDGSKPLFKGKDSKPSGIDVPPAEPTPSVEKEKIDSKKFYDALNKNKTETPKENADKSTSVDEEKKTSEVNKPQNTEAEIPAIKKDEEKAKKSGSRIRKESEVDQIIRLSNRINKLNKAIKEATDQDAKAVLEEQLKQAKSDMESIRTNGIVPAKTTEEKKTEEKTPVVSTTNNDSNPLEPIVVEDKKVDEAEIKKTETNKAVAPVVDNKPAAMDNVKVTNVSVGRAEQVSNPEALRVTPKEIADFIAAKKAYAEAKELNASLTDLLAQRKKELAALVSEFNAARESIGQGLQELNADNAAKKGELADVDVTIANIKSAFK